MKIRGRDIFLFVDFDEEETKKRKGAVFRKQPEELVKRRIFSDGMKVFDGGMEFVSGSFINIDFAVTTTLTLNTGSGGVTTAIPAQSDYEARDLELFGVSFIPDNTRFKELSPGALGLDNYQLALKTSAGDFYLNEANAGSYSNGWKIPPEYLAADDIRLAAFENPGSPNIGGQIFETLYVKGENSDRHKITTVYDYDAPGTSFTLGGPMEVFLMPRFIFQNLFILYNLNTGIGGTTFQEILRPSYIFYDRERYIEGGNSVQSIFTFPLVSSAPKIAEWAAKYPDFIAGKNYNSSADVFKVTYNKPNFSSSIQSVSTFLDPADPLIPPPPGLPLDSNVAGTPGAIFRSYGANAGQYFPGQLVGIIKKGEQLYYFWNVATG